MYKVCIFDLDGTLLDTVESIAHSSNLVLKELGYKEFAAEKYKYFAGDGQRELIRRCLLASNVTDEAILEDALDLYKKSLAENCMYQVKPFDGILELLEDLKKSGRKITVLSNKPHEATVNVVERIFGKGYFDFIQGQQEDVPRKPDPIGALNIANHYECSVAECLYIGDTDTDMQTGNRAGMDTIGVLWGFRDRDELEENHAKHIVSHPKQIWEWVNDKANSQ